jgi:5-methylcytosine-specific restriction endonuclease McrA
MMPRSYHKKYSREYYHKRKKELLHLLGEKCVKCGSTEGLDFDHIDPNSREFKIGKLLNYSKERVLQELSKCQLLCKKCHTNKSKKEGSFNKNRLKGSDISNSKLTENDVHIILNSVDKNSDLSIRFNVSRATIWLIKNRRTWKHVN